MSIPTSDRAAILADAVHAGQSTIDKVRRRQLVAAEIKATLRGVIPPEHAQAAAAALADALVGGHRFCRLVQSCGGAQ